MRADVRVTRELCNRVRKALPPAPYVIPIDVFVNQEDVAALVTLAEAVLDAEESGVLRDDAIEGDAAIESIRALLGKEERPGE